MNVMIETYRQIVTLGILAIGSFTAEAIVYWVCVSQPLGRSAIHKAVTLFCPIRLFRELRIYRRICRATSRSLSWYYVWLMLWWFSVGIALWLLIAVARNQFAQHSLFYSS